MAAQNGNNNVKIIVRRPKMPNHVVLFVSLSIIILAFFILLNAYSTFDDARVKKALDSINFQFRGIFEKTLALFKMFDNPQQEVQVAAGTKLSPGNDLMFVLLKEYYDEYKSLGKFVSEFGMGGRLGIVVTSRGLLISVADDLGFDAASATLSPEGRAFLDRLIPILGPYRNEILIEGHTDDGPPPQGTFTSNWQLSQARAMSVLRHFRNNGIGIARLTASGASEYRPVADNASPESRALNRRVDIIIKHPRLQTEGGS